MASSFALYSLIRLDVMPTRAVGSPNSAFRCFEIRRSSGRDRFRALVWKYRSNASARVIVGVDAAAGSTGGGVLQRVECVLRLSHGTAAPGLTSARCHPNVPAVMDASFCRRRRVLVASVFLFFVLGGCAGLRFSA